MSEKEITRKRGKTAMGKNTRNLNRRDLRDWSRVPQSKLIFERNERERNEREIREGISDILKRVNDISKKSEKFVMNRKSE